ncbi:hypothetical protein H1Z61_09665 [Bacillus aquiflavi]|uniref:Uncharacterized protein n=1 Tax=Bacillus aquiflavi TaxID=2672567 RepID=A0A6B3W196_9BACI|nr:hypothetical protein [Bacillus aquiflavi]MBA4537400.1 hypothetical protein [Bacillus aquiflavi]NEY81656.1 hypothetical protein [Bacillus aquiflavi]UAC49217.1 hypothetical protein K6959_04890 [Bacillus aquiflavi]
MFKDIKCFYFYVEFMNDDMNSDLIDQLKAIHQGGKVLLENMKEVDEKISAKIGSGSS